MADTTPRLNTTPLDPQTDYSPLSWMAATSFSVAVLFAMLLLSLGYFAFRESKPLIEPWLFVFPILGVVLAFAARRHIVNSENTRTGLEWATRAWWICIVGGLCYAAYLGATEYTIRADTEKQFVSWADNLIKVDPATPNDLAMSSAFYQTIPPKQRSGVFSPSSTTVMQERFAQDFVTFRQNKLLMMILRNPGQCELKPQGLKQWQQVPGRIECALAATLSCPEGEFNLIVPMIATVESGKREWQVATFDGYVQDAQGAKRTPYGWMVEWLDKTSQSTVDQFLQAASARTNVDGIPMMIPDALLAQPVAYEVFTKGKISKETGERIVVTAYERAKITGALGLFWPTSPEYAKGLQKDFFVQVPLPDGKMMADATREDLLFCWTNVAFDKITMSGRTLSNSPDKNSMIRFFPDRVEISVPIELKLLKSDPKNSAALGRMVLTLDDPVILAKLTEAREVGLKAGQSMNFPDDLPRACPWKVTRIESNLKIVRTGPPPGGGPPGGGPPGGMDN